MPVQLALVEGCRAVVVGVAQHVGLKDSGELFGERWVDESALLEFGEHAREVSEVAILGERKVRAQALAGHGGRRYAQAHLA